MKQSMNGVLVRLKSQESGDYYVHKNKTVESVKEHYGDKVEAIFDHENPEVFIKALEL